MTELGNMAWQRTAACAGPAGVGVDFFAEDPAGIAAAQQVCNGCPVRRQCLAWAQNERITDGVWGGVTFAEHRPLSRPVRPPVRADVVATASGAAQGGRSGDGKPRRADVIEVSGELADRLRWLARYLNAYVPQLPVRSVSELVTETLQREIDTTVQRWGIQLPDHGRGELADRSAAVVAA